MESYTITLPYEIGDKVKMEFCNEYAINGLAEFTGYVIDIDYESPDDIWVNLCIYKDWVNAVPSPIHGNELIWIDYRSVENVEIIEKHKSHLLKSNGVKRIYDWARNVKTNAQHYTSFRIGSAPEEQVEVIEACRDVWLMKQLIKIIEEEYPEVLKENKECK